MYNLLITNEDYVVREDKIHANQKVGGGERLAEKRET